MAANGNSKWIVGIGLALSSALGLAGWGRADHIDDGLLKKTPELMKSLQDKGYQNVGVIKFMVKKGSSAPSANVGPLNLNMATRLENALIAVLDAQKPIGVTRDATEVAASRDSKFSAQTPAGRSALFKHSYPLAWGKTRVTPDAFLTGVVELSADMQRTTVTIDLIDKKSADLKRLTAFTVPTDRSILADSGQSFAISRKLLAKKRGDLSELEAEAANSAAAADSGKAVSQQISGEVPIKFDIRYDGAPQTVTGDSGSLGELRVEPPQKGQAVAFYLTNLTKEKLGLVVKVNGESCLYNETEDDNICTKWILEPGKEYALQGFYSSNNSVSLFKVLDDQESVARMAEWAGSRPRAGYIDIAVFRENIGGEEPKYSRTLRGPRPTASSRPATALQARDSLRKYLGSALNRGRGLIVGEGEVKPTNLQEDQIRSAALFFNMQVNYYRPQ